MDERRGASSQESMGDLARGWLSAIGVRVEHRRLVRGARRRHVRRRCSGARGWLPLRIGGGDCRHGGASHRTGAAARGAPTGPASLRPERHHADGSADHQATPSARPLRARGRRLFGVAALEAARNHLRGGGGAAGARRFAGAPHRRQPEIGLCASAPGRLACCAPAPDRARRRVGRRGSDGASPPHARSRWAA